MRTQDVLEEEARCKKDDAANDAARYQELSHTYRLANTGSRPSAAWMQRNERNGSNMFRQFSS